MSTQHHGQGHVYRAQNINRIIHQFGNKPSAQVKQGIREELVQEKDRFLGMDKLRSQQQQHDRKHGHGR